MTEDQLQALQKRLGKKLRRNVDLHAYLTIRTGGAASCFTEATGRDELIDAVGAAQAAGVPYIVVGGGSNIAAMHASVDLFVIKNSYSDLETVKEGEDEVEVKVSSGYSMARLVSMSVEKGWEGLEYHKGLPGSIGGAIYMNSKWTRPWKFVGDYLVSAVLLDSFGKEKEVGRDYFEFAYDYSTLQKTKETVIEAVFRLPKADPVLLARRAAEALEYRKKTQPFGVATAGCFFRNISKEDQLAKGLTTTSAGYLIDQAGMKGKKSGAYAVSDIHANFIVHQGGNDGRPDDLLQLVKEIKDKIREKYGIELKEEVVGL